MHLNFQAVIKQFSGTGFERSDSVVIDEVELQQHQRLEKLYSSTRSGRVRKGKLHRSILCMAESQNLKLQSHICYRFKAMQNGPPFSTYIQFTRSSFFKLIARETYRSTALMHYMLC
jgi:hypothetical protein